MNKIKKSLLIGAATVGMSASVAVAAPPAQAGTVCNITGICGRVINTGSWTGRIDSNLGDKKPFDLYLAPGRDSKSLTKDTDAIYAVAGTGFTMYACSNNRYMGQYGSKSYAVSKKISDGTCVNVRWFYL